MTRSLVTGLAAIAALAVAAPALADHHMEPKPEVVEKNARGQVTKVKIGDTIYPVCMGEMTDGCIQPRAAGLKWGNRPLDHWPGKPASE